MRYYAIATADGEDFDSGRLTGPWMSEEEAKINALKLLLETEVNYISTFLEGDPDLSRWNSLNYAKTLLEMIGFLTRWDGTFRVPDSSIALSSDELLNVFSALDYYPTICVFDLSKSNPNLSYDDLNKLSFTLRDAIGEKETKEEERMNPLKNLSTERLIKELVNRGELAK